MIILFFLSNNDYFLKGTITTFIDFDDVIIIFSNKSQNNEKSTRLSYFRNQLSYHYLITKCFRYVVIIRCKTNSYVLLFKKQRHVFIVSHCPSLLTLLVHSSFQLLKNYFRIIF